MVSLVECTHVIVVEEQSDICLVGRAGEMFNFWIFFSGISSPLKVLGKPLAAVTGQWSMVNEHSNEMNKEMENSG